MELLAFWADILYEDDVIFFLGERKIGTVYALGTFTVVLGTIHLPPIVLVRERSRSPAHPSTFVLVGSQTVLYCSTGGAKSPPALGLESGTPR